MTFEEILDQAIAMLQRRGRLTYGALKRQFQLDDAYLDDVKHELIGGQRLAVDEDGRVLVWTGAPAAPEPDAPRRADAESRFQALLSAVMWWLQRERRVTYRTLKYLLGLDETLLQEIREELTFRRLVIDEDSKGLVWTGEAHPGIPTPGEVPSQPAPANTMVVRSPTVPLTLLFTETLGPSPGPTISSDSMAPDAPPDEPSIVSAPARMAPDAERRQVTVMFCDLVASTELSQQLDPEDYRAVVRAYQAAAAAALQPYEGYIAQYLGDGLLVYFGWPQAHEDAAHRAVHASLALLDALGPLHETHLVPRYGVRIAVRIGLHTGLAVIGAMGSDDRYEHLAMGDTPNLAARIQGLAAPNTVVLSAATGRLVQGAFALEDLGTHALKGVAEPMPVYRVLGPIEAQHDEDEAPALGVPTLVGRDEEIGLLRRRWDQAREGLGQVVLINGEAGIGKSALVRAVRQHIGREGVVRMTYRCSPYHTHSAFYPIIVHLERLLQFERDDPPTTRLTKLERLLTTYPFPLEEVVPLFAALLSVPLPEGAYPPLALTPQQQRQHTHDALLAWLWADAQRQPVLMVWDDVHWADPSTLENLSLLVDQIPTSPILAVLTFRPEFVPPWPPRSHMTSLTLNRLERPQIEALARRQAGGKRLPPEVVAHIVAKTDGVPLFVEELTKMILESALLREEADHYALTGSLSAVTIPATLQDSLLARLDRLPTMREVAQIGAVLGREFAYEMLHALVTVDDRTLQEGLAQLVATELLYQRGRPPRATYTFKHALVQDAAYQSLLKRTRQQYHQQVAALLEARFPETVATAPEVVAHHYTEAGCAAQALPLWQQAGQRAIQRSANLEGIAHLTRGLAVLATLPETTDRLQHELDLHVTLGPALIATRGYASPEAEHTFARAWEICQRLGEPPERFPVLYGLCAFYFVGGKYRQARDQAEQFLHLAQLQGDADSRMVAHRALGVSLYYMGEVAQAREHFAQSVVLDDPQQDRTLAFRYGQDPGVAALVYDAFALWTLGYADQALRRSHEACTRAEDLEHPFTLAYAFCQLAIFHQLRRDREEAWRHAEAAVRVSREQGFLYWLGVALILQSWARANVPQSAEQLPSMHEGMAIYRATDAAMWLPYFLTLLAETYGATGQPDAGLRLLDEAHTIMDNTQERFYKAEVHRVQGELVLAQAANQHALAETCFQQALDIARHQQARSWELRAAMSLARLWQQQGKCAEARQLLAPIYGWFAEGLDTADLQEAKALLEALT
jgi:class 3 adenylate cyclase/predicted ATPase